MSLNRLEIVYITGATACGKGTLGSRLARHFNFYHISMGDLRRAHGQSLRAGVPWMSEAIKQCIREGREIPEELSRDYDVLPAVLQLHNRKVNGTLGWTVDLASAMINEEIAEARRVSRDWRVKYTGIIIDGHPLTGGRISEDVLDRCQSQYSGLTIVLESPRDVARQRYLDRARLPSEDEVRFEARMELTDRILPNFIEMMRNRGEIVRSANNEDMDIDDAYQELCSQLAKSNAWTRLTRRVVPLGS